MAKNLNIAMINQSWRQRYQSVPYIYFNWNLPHVFESTVFTKEMVNDPDGPYEKTAVDDRRIGWMSRQKQFIIDTTEDPITKAGFQERYHLIEDIGLGDRVIWVTDDLELQQLYKNTVSWPRDLACSARRLQMHYHPAVTPGARTTLVSCLNRQFRAHRAYLIWLLRSRSYFPQAITSCNAYVDSYTGESLDLDHESFLDLPLDLRQSMNQINLYHTSGVDDDDWCNDHSFTHPAFSDTYLNVVTESIIEPGVYFSEKTFKPLAAGQLFLLLGCAGSMQYLRQLGIGCFDWDLKYHGYEHYGNWMTRAEKLIQLLDEIYPDIPDIYHTNYEQILHNYHLIRSPDFLTQCERSLRQYDLIKSYRDQ